MPLESPIARSHGPRVLWICGAFVAAGFGALEHYAVSDGGAANPPVAIEKRSTRPQALAFFHPLCPCSRACVSELERVVRAADPSVDLRAYVTSGAELGPEDSGSDLVARLGAIPGIVVERDPDGAIARRFGVETSGTVLVYSAGGELLFDGGITAARGHEGANSFAHAFQERIATGRGPRITTPVFGCALGGRTRNEEVAP